MDESFIQYYSEKRVEQTESALEEELRDIYKVPVTVCFTWEKSKETYANKYLLEGIQITQISIKNVGDMPKERIKEMTDYVAKNYCSEVLIE